MAQIKAVIFDMDGVLIDAKDWHYEALNRALELFGYTINRYDHLTTFDGLPTRRKLEILSREKSLPVSMHTFLNELKQIYTLELVHAHCKPIFQHEYALSHLKAMGYKLAVASNSIRNTIEIMMEKSNLRPYLDAIVSNQDVAIGKPDPEIYDKTIALLGVTPRECLVLEDNENGIRAARAAGTNLMTINTVFDVTLDNILNQIQHLEVEAA
jgi:beta-phosphoglucomutase